MFCQELKENRKTPDDETEGEQMYICILAMYIIL